MSTVYVSLIVFFLASGGVTVIKPEPFPTLKHCEAHMQFAEPGGVIRNHVIEKAGSRVVGAVTECLPGEQAADYEFMKRFLDERIPETHRDKRLKGISPSRATRGVSFEPLPVAEPVNKEMNARHAL